MKSIIAHKYDRQMSYLCAIILLGGIYASE